jgi:hypothetical protein
MVRNKGNKEPCADTEQAKKREEMAKRRVFHIQSESSSAFAYSNHFSFQEYAKSSSKTWNPILFPFIIQIIQNN